MPRRVLRRSRVAGMVPGEKPVTAFACARETPGTRTNPLLTGRKLMLFTSSTAILRAVQALTVKVDALMSQSDEIAADVTTIEAGVAKISAGVTSALALITKLEAQVASGQPVDPAVLASLKAAVADVGTAADSVGTLAPPAS